MESICSLVVFLCFRVKQINKAGTKEKTVLNKKIQNENPNLN